MRSVFLRWCRYRLSDPAKADRFEPVTTYRLLFEQMTESALAWLASGRLWYRLVGEHYLVVHAGIPPRMNTLPHPYPLQQPLTAHQRKQGYLLEHLRYLDEADRPVSLEREQPHHRFWAERYDGRFGHLLFGHQAWLGAIEPVRFAHATGLDLGCVHGGRLAALILEAGAITGWQTVDAHQLYAPWRHPPAQLTPL